MKKVVAVSIVYGVSAVDHYGRESAISESPTVVSPPAPDLTDRSRGDDPEQRGDKP